MPLTDREVQDRHRQSLGEAKAACLELARFQDHALIAPRGRHYVILKEALARLEGSARQLGYLRDDTRWMALGIQYAKIKQACQVWFIGQRWKRFELLAPAFDRWQRDLEDLATRRTGKRGPILPTPGNMNWLIMPDWRSPFRMPRESVH